MIISSIIVDDFYNDPHETREFALQQEFNVIGNYPGFRSKPFYNQSVVDLIQDIVFFLAKIYLILCWHYFNKQS